MDQYGIKSDTITKINAVFSKFNEIDKVIIYGSRAKGTYKNGSDIDLCLFGNNLNLDILNKILLSLDDLFLAYTFDISIFKHILNPDLISHIERVGKVFYQR